jgi:ketosteroid isomerase-like protein
VRTETEVNRPETVAAVAEAFAEYERALVRNDCDVLNAAFWPSEHTIRFGIADMQAGAEAIAEWRREQSALPPGRTLADTRITTIGDDIAIVTTLFTYPGRPRLGRQSQTWARLADGWRIVSAHVSEVEAPIGS